jgi:MFS family permease
MLSTVLKLDLGQVLLLIGDLTKDVRLMTVGIFIFGIGTSPLSVVQETIIVRFFKSHGLGISLAIGLIAGKGASFVSAATSYPLTQRYGSHAPFFVATFLTGLSVAINLVYVTASKWLIEEAGAEPEASDIRSEAQLSSTSLSEAQALEKVAAKHLVNFRDVTRLGDMFWA